MAKLTLKQQRFCDEYIISGNATEAAVKAGYSERSASNIGEENLRKPQIKAYIDERLEKLQSEKIASQEEILEFLTAIVRGEKTEEVLIGVGKGAQSISDIEVSAKERLKAAELLGKRHRMWTDKLDVTATGEIQINVGAWGDEDEPDD